MHNNITHQEGPTSIPEAVHALCSMQATLAGILTGEDGPNGKGTAPCSLSVKKKKNKTVVEEQERKSKWEPPPVGWVKFNVDGSFVQQSGEAGIGVIARDSSVQVILTARRVLFRCQGAVEAEVRACREGFRLAAQWTQGPVIIESDCARIVQAMKEREDRSAISFILMEAKVQARLLPEWRVAKVRRECNLVANDLAQLAKRSMHTAVWLGRAPACVESTVANDCTPSN
jgi:ribonuclease HI